MPSLKQIPILYICIEELIDGIGQSTFITTLDLTTDGISEQGQDSVCHALWKIPIPNYANWFNLSTFYLPKVDEVLWELHPFVRAYLDDILIHSATWEDHLRHLSRVLQWIRQAGLRIKAQKCNFAVNECKYLGHIVGKGRIRQCSVKWMPCKFSHNLQQRIKSESLPGYVGTTEDSSQTFRNCKTSDGINSEKNG